VEVKIGVLHTPREIVFDSAQTPTEVEKLVTDGLAKNEGTLAFVDERGRKIIVAVSVVAYVEIAQATERRVGFVAG
jgi:hypothetical protein